MSSSLLKITWDLWCEQLPLRSVTDQSEIDGNVIFLHYQFEDFSTTFAGWDHYFFEETSEGWQVGGWNPIELYRPECHMINMDKRGLRITSADPKSVEILQETPEVARWHNGILIPDDIAHELEIPFIKPTRINLKVL